MVNSIMYELWRPLWLCSVCVFLCVWGVLSLLSRCPVLALGHAESQWDCSLLSLRARDRHCISVLVLSISPNKAHADNYKCPAHLLVNRNYLLSGKASVLFLFHNASLRYCPEEPA